MVAKGGDETRFLWRIGTDTPGYTADDMSGTGSKITGGRWNLQGQAMVYCSSNIALACLETWVHLREGDLPFNRYLVRIEVPESLWQGAAIFDAAAHVGWDAVPKGMVSIEAGKRFVAEGASALMRVPSVIVPEEDNVLINPLHPTSRTIRAVKVRKWLYDGRMR